eukprot:GAHX01006001.1.p2 GENE.GAHX01006001.1~~GAHX01006001.1.p2  ORF type:complete len:67 (+),score=1.73 GAHX01006001.1:1-201(+)
MMLPIPEALYVTLTLLICDHADKLGTHFMKTIQNSPVLEFPFLIFDEIFQGFNLHPCPPFINAMIS